MSVLRHEMWRDEIQAWSIVIGSRSVGDLLHGALRYEGHPPLWYLVLMPITGPSDPRMMQVLAIAALRRTAIVVVRLSPWSRRIQIGRARRILPAVRIHRDRPGRYALGMPLTFLLLVDRLAPTP